MDVVFISNSGESLPIVYRLRREGVDAQIYLHSPQYSSNYDGLLTKLSARDLPKAVRKSPIVIFDITRPNERTKQDVTLLKLFGLKENLPSVFGPLADKLHKDCKVIGSAALTEQLELDRRKGMQLAKEVGFTLPEAHEFKTLAEGASFLKGREDLWVLKPHNNQDLDLTYVEKFPGELYIKLTTEYRDRLDCEYTLQKKVEGAEVSTEVWIADAPVHFNHTIESKRLMAGNLGLSVGSQSNTVWIETRGSLVNLLTKAAKRLKGYRGPLDANCIISNGVPYFLEWSPRFGYDAIYCLLTLLKSSLKDFFLNDFKAEFHKGYAASQRVSIPPYPYDNPTLRKTLAAGRIIENDLARTDWFWAQDVKRAGEKIVCAGADGILGIVTGRGSLQEAWGRVYHNLGKLKVTTYLQYRNDGLKEAEKRIRGLGNA